MWWIADIILMLAVELCSWRVWLCIGAAVGIVVGLHVLYPEKDGLWSVSYPAALVVIALGFRWEHRAG
jgi:predicted branched-subunit amino acid permease